ncbi:MAG: hypothetical protein KC643_14605, partial [Nitrospira sp.]|nr:hypothetical protein [Nitrospira sp.]
MNDDWRVKTVVAGVSALAFLCVPSSGWGTETERGIHVQKDRSLVLSGSEGVVTRGLDPTGGPEVELKFGDTLVFGQLVITGVASQAEILIGRQELVTVSEHSAVRIMEGHSGTPSLNIDEGTIRVAVVESRLNTGESMKVKTASTEATSHGGVFQVTVGRSAGRAVSSVGSESREILRVSYSSIAQREPSVVTYRVDEGMLQVEANAQSILMEAGQSVEVVDGHLGIPFSTPPGLPLAPRLTAVADHRNTPQAGISYLASQEMTQAGILGEVLGGIAAQVEQVEEEPKAEQNVILATTGGTLTAVNTNLPPLGNLFPVASELGGPTSSLIDPAGNDNFNIIIGPAGPTIPQAQGGGGLLLYNNSDVTLNAQLNNGNGSLRIQYTPINSELLLVDGGTPTLAPHQGEVPFERLTVQTLVGGNFLPVDLINRTPGRPLFLPFPSAVPSGDPIELVNAANISHVFTRFTDPLDKANSIGVLETFAGSTQVVPGTGDEVAIFPRKFLAGSGSSSEEVTDGVHGVIRARNLFGSGLLTIPGGVVLNNQTNVTATGTGATSTYFTQPGDVEGSVLAVLGRNFDLRVEDQILVPDESIPDFIEIIPGSQGGGQLNPVNVKMLDRVLAVLDGSTIAPDTSDPLNIPRVSLLTILDSRLEGPTEPPILGNIPGDTFPVGLTPPQVNGISRTRSDIPPLIEVLNSGTPNLDSSDPAFQWAVETHSAVVVRGELHQAILEASAPLIGLFQSTMMTTGDFAQFQGNGNANSATFLAALQQANVLQGAVQLNNSQLQVGGHLFNFLNGTTGQVVGNLAALANGSNLTVNGALIAVGLNSSFTLSGGSLVAFGFGTNSVNITGTSGTCAGCALSTTVPNLDGIPVLLHPSATVSVGNGFVPYAGVGQGTINAGNFDNSVNVSPGAA